MGNQLIVCIGLCALQAMLLVSNRHPVVLVKHAWHYKDIMHAGKTTMSPVP